MSSAKPVLDRPILVEGKYDKNTLSQLVDAHIVPLGGFSMFHNRDLVALLRRLARERGVLVLTDSDRGGMQIRHRLAGILPPDRVTHLYIPKIEGKESRKAHRSREGYLGVEGMDRETLLRLLAPFFVDAPPRKGLSLTKADFYRLGLSGGEGSAALRARLAAALDLPQDLSATALLDTVNLLCTEEEWEKALAQAQSAPAQ